jgi:predicted phosphoadenosine phosphosulfate sulfurtransferase
MKWRKKFLLAGASFQWWCVEVKHFSAYNQLTNDESYTCWDHTKEDVWVRRPPPFALRNHPKLRPGIDNYQSFLPKVTGDGIVLVGVMASESVQRLQYMAALNLGAGQSITGKNMIYPLYDWKRSDVWLYLKENKVDIPIIYLWLYQTGTRRNQLRISQFFSIDCVGSLIRLAEYEPGLWEKILRREPNAYMAALYWDSELFRRSSRKRRENENKDYKALVRHMLFEDSDKYFTTDLTRRVANEYRKLIIKTDNMIRDRDWRNMYDALVAGDPKLRTLRAIRMNIATSYAEYAKTFRKGGERSG